VKERSWQELGTRLADPRTRAIVDIDPDLLEASELIVVPRGSELAYYAKCVGLSMAIAAGAILAVALGSAGLRKLAEPPTPASAPYQATTPTSTGKSDVRKKLSPPPAPAPRVEPAKEPIAEARVERPTREPRSEPKRRGVDAEVALLQRATRAQKQDPTRALALLEQHAREFPNGAFADVREVHRAEALCALGRREEARKAVRDFLRKYPGSHSTSRMRRICNEEEEGG
jgi:hypothetical protein